MSGKLAYDEAHRVVAVCIVYREDSADGHPRFLACQRSRDRKIFPGKWGSPGGGLSRSDYIDTPQTLYDGWHNPHDQALRREVMQEVGLEVGSLTYVGSFSHITGDDVAVFGLRFAAPYKSGVVTLEQRELADFQWVRADEVAKLDCMGGFVEAVREVNKMLSMRDLRRAAC